MASKLFTGNYGSPLAQINTAPLERAGAAWGQAFQNFGKEVAGAIEKFQLDKNRKEMKPFFVDQMVAGGIDQDVAEKTFDSISKDKTNLEIMNYVQKFALLQKDETRRAGMYPTELAKAQQDLDAGEQAIRIRESQEGRAAGMYPTELAKAQQDLDAGEQAIRIRESQEGRAAGKYPLELAQAGFELDRLKTEGKINELQYNQVKDNLAVNEAIAGMQRLKDGNLFTPGEYSPQVLDRAKQEFVKRERNTAIFDLEIKKGKVDINRIKALIEGGTNHGTSQMERSLKLLRDNNKITKDQELEYTEAWVKKTNGLDGLSDDAQYKLAKTKRLSSGGTIETVRALIGIAEAGGEYSGKPVKYKNGVLEYQQLKDGILQKVRMKVSDQDKVWINAFNELEQRVFPLFGDGSEPVTPGTSLTDKDQDALIDQSF